MAGSTATLPRTSPLGLPLRVSGDERLVHLASQGDERAFATIYERHAQPLYRYCRSIVRDDHDAQDVLQTSMTRALAALQKGPPDAPLRPWLFRIAHNEAITLLRSARPTGDLHEAAGLTGPSAEVRAEERARLAQLVEDLADLPDRQRSALVMRELNGLSHADIATALDVSLAVAKQTIFEARVGLQEFEKGRAIGCAEVQRTISDADGRKLRGRPVRAHLRACPECRGMREAIGRRRTDLAALAPALPTTTGAAILAKLFGGGGSAGGGGLAAGTAATAGKAGVMAISTKFAAGAAVAAIAGAGTPVVVERIERHPPPLAVVPATPGAVPAAAAAGASGRALPKPEHHSLATTVSAVVWALVEPVATAMGVPMPPAPTPPASLPPASVGAATTTSVAAPPATTVTTTVEASTNGHTGTTVATTTTTTTTTATTTTVTTTTTTQTTTATSTTGTEQATSTAASTTERVATPAPEATTTTSATTTTPPASTSTSTTTAPATPAT